MIRSPKITKAARGQACTVNIAGECSYDSETVVYAHLPDESHGMALKADDLCGCFSCSRCHDFLDGRARCPEYTDNRDFYMRRAMVRTWRKLFELGVLQIA